MSDLKETYIFTDWSVIKANIWDSWNSFLSDLSALVMYNNLKKDSVNTRASIIRNFTRVFINIGETRFAKHVPDEDLLFLKNLFNLILKGEDISLSQFNEAREIIDVYFDVSGMGKLDVKKDDLNIAVEDNR